MKDGRTAIIAGGLVMAGVGVYLLLKKKVVPPEVPPEIPAELSLSNLAISPAQVNVGEPITISVTATNVGDVAGSFSIPFVVDGEVATESVTLAPSESKAVSIEVTPSEAGSYSVAVGELTRSFEAIEVAPPPVAALVIWYGTGAPGELWDVTISGQAGMPSGLKETNTPCTFPSITSPGTYEMQIVKFGEEWKGPFQFTLTEVGEYYWDPTTEKLDGIPTIDLSKIPPLPSRSFVIGRYYSTGTAGIGYPFPQGTLIVTITIDEAIEISGYENTAKQFIGQTISAPYPDAGLWFRDGSPEITHPVRGTKCTCYLSKKAITTKGIVWGMEELREYTTYPPSAFNFSGSLEVSNKRWSAGKFLADVAYQVSGTVPRFAANVVVSFRTEPWPTWTPIKAFIGPSSGVVVTAFPSQIFSILAHPDPNKEFDMQRDRQGTWEFHNWQLVASVVGY